MAPTEQAKRRRRKRILIVLAVWVTLRIVSMVAFRRHNRRVTDAVRHFNHRCLNPVMLWIAGRPHWYAARLDHRGRRSGRSYATPVVAKPVEGGFAVPLPYGTAVDWLRNLQAAGGGELRIQGRTLQVRRPRVVPTGSIASQLPPLYRFVSRLYRIEQWVMLEEGSTDDVAVAGEVAGPATSAPR